MPNDVNTYVCLPATPRWELCINGCVGCRDLLLSWAPANPRWRIVLTGWETSASTDAILLPMAYALVAENEQDRMVLDGRYINLDADLVVECFAYLRAEYRYACSRRNTHPLPSSTNNPNQPQVRSSRRCTCSGDCAHRRSLATRRSPIPGDPPLSYQRFLKRDGASVGMVGHMVNGHTPFRMPSDWAGLEYTWSYIDSAWNDTFEVRVVEPPTPEREDVSQHGHPVCESDDTTLGSASNPASYDLTFYSPVRGIGSILRVDDSS